MNHAVKVLTLTLLAISVNLSTYAQKEQFEWQKKRKSSETLIGTVSIEKSGGSKTFWAFGGDDDDLVEYSSEELYNFVLQEANRKYAESYPNLIIREFIYDCIYIQFKGGSGTGSYNGFSRKYVISAAVVIPNYQKMINEATTKAVEKAFRNIREGSRIAIDIVTVASGIGIDKATVKDMVVDVLLDKDYKVVAKEYLEKLYNEQQQQQSGIYNDRTTVQENNFSAVGYYINVKVTETSLRLQVINVSTGEYESNTTVNF